MDHYREYSNWKAKAVLLNIFDRYNIDENELELRGLSSDIRVRLSGSGISDNIANSLAAGLAANPALTASMPSSLITALGMQSGNIQPLTTIAVPKVKTIGIKAMAEMNGLERVTIPGTVRFIKGGAFYRCPKLAEVNFESGDIEISGTAFDGTPWIRKMQEKYPFLRTQRENGDVVLHKVFPCETFKVTPDIGTIAEAAFRNNKRIQIVSFEGSRLTMIPENCFRSALKLWKVYFGENIRSIGFRAFYGCRDLEEVVIPEGIERIEALAFAKCRGLKKVVLPSTLKIIETCAFAGSPVEELVIPESVQYVYNDILGCGEFFPKVKMPEHTIILHGRYRDAAENYRYDYYDPRSYKRETLDDEITLSPENCENKAYPIEADNVEDLENLRKAFSENHKSYEVGEMQTEFVKVERY